MKKKICQREEKVIAGLKAKKLSSDIEKHVSECHFCQETVSIYRWMNEFKNRSWDAEKGKKILPDSETIWDRAFNRQRPDRTLVKKALKPMIYPRILSYPIFIIGFLLLFISNVKGIGNFLDSRFGTSPFLDLLSKIIPQILPIFLIPGFVILVSILFYVLVVSFERRKHPVKMPY